jgi:hypothetical protein
MDVNPPIDNALPQPKAKNKKSQMDQTKLILDQKQVLHEIHENG